MKKLIPYLMAALVGFAVFSCKDDDIDQDTFPIAIDLQNVDLENIDGVFQISRAFTSSLYSSDVVLIFMQNGNISTGSPVWQAIPITFYLADGHEVDYNYDFSKEDFVIYAGGTFDLTNTSYVKNKTFRILIVPAATGKSANVDLTDYESVINYFHIDDSNPTVL
ncbi:MAG: hypothetical protein WDA08_00200 [Weeksellaceae bacterium]